MTPHGAFHWNELMTTDLEGAKAFYGKTLGWRFDGMPMPDGTYWVATSGSQPVAGLMDATGMLPPGTPPHWFCYIAVDDVDARVADAVAQGATVLKPAFDIPNVGRIVILTDPQGVAQGWMTPTPI